MPVILSLLATLVFAAEPEPPKPPRAAKPAQAIATTASSPALDWGPCPTFLGPECRVAVIHGSADQPNADILFKTPGRSSLPSHTHTSAERIVLIQGELTVTYQGQAPITVKQGGYLWGPPGKPHAAQCTSKSACILFIAFNEPVDAFPSSTLRTPTPISQ